MRRAVDRVDANLVARVGAESVAHARATLLALSDAPAEAELVGRFGDR